MDKKKENKAERPILLESASSVEVIKFYLDYYVTDDNPKIQTFYNQPRWDEKTQTIIYDKTVRILG
jgi:hypothetical protein